MAADDARAKAVARDSLLVGATLALVAGYVDAVGLARLDVFPSNQSGNIVFFGMAIGGNDTVSGWRAGASILGFLLGAATAFAIARRVPSRRRAPIVVGMEVALLAVAALAAAAPRLGATVPDTHGWVALVVASVAMGVQTEAIRRVAGVAVSTTYQSGTVARAAEAVVDAGPRTERRDRAWKSLGVVGAILGTYAAGAALGAALDDGHRTVWLVPIGIVALVLVAATVSPRVSAAMEPPT